MKDWRKIKEKTPAFYLAILGALFFGISAIMCAYLFDRNLDSSRYGFGMVICFIMALFYLFMGFDIYDDNVATKRYFAIAERLEKLNDPIESMDWGLDDA